MSFGLSGLTGAVVRLPLAAVVVLAACVQDSSPQASVELETLRLIEEMEATDRALGFAPSILGKVLSPPGLADAVDDFSPSDLFRSASGYYVSLNSLPALYSGGGGFTIVAPQFERTFPGDSLDAAIREFVELLAKRGITGTDSGGELER